MRFFKKKEDKTDEAIEKMKEELNDLMDNIRATDITDEDYGQIQKEAAIWLEVIDNHQEVKNKRCDILNKDMAKIGGVGLFTLIILAVESKGIIIHSKNALNAIMKLL